MGTPPEADSPTSAPQDVAPRAEDSGSAQKQEAASQPASELIRADETRGTLASPFLDAIATVISGDSARLGGFISGQFLQAAYRDIVGRLSILSGQLDATVRDNARLRDALADERVRSAKLETQLQAEQGVRLVKESAQIGGTASLVVGIDLLHREMYAPGLVLVVVGGLLLGVTLWRTRAKK